MKSMLTNCRGCFKFIDTDAEKYWKLSEPLKTHNLTYGEFLSSFTGLCFEDQQEVLCFLCRQNLNLFHNFYQKVLETNEKFTILRNNVKVELPQMLSANIKEEEVKVEVFEEYVPNMEEEFSLVRKEETIRTIRTTDVPAKRQKKSYYRPKKERKEGTRQKRRQFTEERKLNLQKYKRNEEGLYECPVEHCSGLFKQMGKLEMHLEDRHLDQQSFPCEHCGEEFSMRHNYRRHILKVHTARPYICDICGHNYVDRGSIRTHMRLIHLPKKDTDKEYPCPICGKFFTTATGMRRHRQQIHRTCPKELIPKPFKCETCGAQWTTPSQLRKHMQYHEAPQFFCDFCGKGFSTKGALTIHIHRHINLRISSYEK